MEDNKDTKVGEVVEEQEKEESTKTYTKEDLKNSFEAGKKKAKEQWLSEWQNDENYKSYLKWQKGNQTDSDKINELQTNNTNLQTNVDSLTKENAYLKAQIQVSNSDVKKEFSKFVTSEVLELVNDTTDFEAALTNYKKENPQYFGEVIVKKVQTSPNLTGGSQKPSTVNDIFNNMVRGT